MHRHVEAPEESRRDGLALLGAHVHLAPVDGSAAHPFLCGAESTRGARGETVEPQWQLEASVAFASGQL